MSIVGYTTGVFDLFHIGHLNILRRARMDCDYLIVGVTTDELAYERKQRHPVVPFSERMALVEACKFVDEVVPQVKIDELEDWRQLKFDRIFKGGDWKGTERWTWLEKEFEQVGVKVEFFAYTEHTSSTKLRAALEYLEKGQEVRS